MTRTVTDKGQATVPAAARELRRIVRQGSAGFVRGPARRLRLVRACSKRQRSGRLRSHNDDGCDTVIMAMTRR